MAEDITWDSSDLTGGPVDHIFAALRTAFPDIHIRRISMTHAADDDNVWFIKRQSGTVELQLDSTSSGNPPFLLESDTERASTENATEAIEIATSWLSK